MLRFITPTTIAYLELQHFTDACTHARHSVSCSLYHDDTNIIFQCT